MRVARHDHVLMLFGETEQPKLQVAQAERNLLDLRFDIESKIKRDLVVPTSRGVKFGSRGADALGQRRFDIHMHIFKRLVPLKFAGFNLLLDLAQSIVDLEAFVARNDADRGQSSSVRQRTGDIVLIKPPVERNRFSVTLRYIRRWLAESSFAHWPYHGARFRVTV